jgi:hypothetical protein
MGLDNNQKAFFELVKAGLWEQDVRLLPFGIIKFADVQQLAEEQSVIGIVTAGLEHVGDTKVPKNEVLPFIGQTLKLEQKNKAMNFFISVIVDKMRNKGIDTLLVKGQGVAQCYERPLRRSCGDVDFFLSEDNYKRAQTYLIPLASSVDDEDKRKKHHAMTIGPWVVELHGLMPTQISNRINDGVCRVQSDIFENGGVRIWNNEGVDVFLPSPDNDAIIIFTHFLQHFFVGGVGLRQICDWCRLLWFYRESIDRGLLYQRLCEMGIVSEWRAFASFAVTYLGMPKESMPLYEESNSLRRKSNHICKIIIESGNFGHNKDVSYRVKNPIFFEKIITFWRRLGEFLRLSMIFPLDGPKFFCTYVRKRAFSRHE